MSMQDRIDIKAKSKERIKALSFGDPVTNICAGENNPHRHSYFVAFKIKSHRNKYDIIHNEYLAKCTDRKGNFWHTNIDVIISDHLDYDKCEE